MRIPLDQIQKPGKKVSGTAEDAWVTAAVQTVRGTPGEPTQDPHETEGALSAEIEFTIRRVGGRFRVKGPILIELHSACDRCGTSTRVTISGDVDQIYEAPGMERDASDIDLDHSELEVGWHDGQAIDMETVLMEALALLGPDRVRCEDEGVSRISGDHPCVLPEIALEGGPERANPFASLKLPQ
jgi:uncharacterized metal-binding protein YceD (DUF177 family)